MRESVSAWKVEAIRSRRHFSASCLVNWQDVKIGKMLRRALEYHSTCLSERAAAWMLRWREGTVRGRARYGNLGNVYDQTRESSRQSNTTASVPEDFAGSGWLGGGGQCRPVIPGMVRDMAYVQENVSSCGRCRPSQTATMSPAIALKAESGRWRPWACAAAVANCQ